MLSGRRSWRSALLKAAAALTPRQVMNCGICCATGILLGSYWPIVVLPAVLVPLNYTATLEESGILPSLCIAAAVRCFGVVLRTAIEMGAVFLATAFLMQTFSGTEEQAKPARKPTRRARVAKSAKLTEKA